MVSSPTNPACYGADERRTAIFNYERHRCRSTTRAMPATSPCCGRCEYFTPNAPSAKSPAERRQAAWGWALSRDAASRRHDFSPPPIPWPQRQPVVKPERQAATPLSAASSECGTRPTDARMRRRSRILLSIRPVCKPVDVSRRTDVTRPGSRHGSLSISGRRARPSRTPPTPPARRYHRQGGQSTGVLACRRAAEASPTSAAGDVASPSETSPTKK